MSNDNKIFAGIDVAKAKFDLAFSNSKNVLTFQSTPAGIEALLEELKKHEIEMVCLEATGNYQHFLVEALHDHGFRIAVVNPRLPRDFAKAQNKLAKTDRIDSRNLAQYAQVMKPRETPRKSKTLLRLHSFVTRRRQLKDMQT